MIDAAVTARPASRILRPFKTSAHHPKQQRATVPDTSAVAREHVDFVERLVESANRCDAGGVMACYGDDAVLKFHDINPAAVSPLAVGKDAVRAWVDDWFAMFGSDNQWEVHDLLDLGLGQVFVDATIAVRGETAGVPVSARIGLLFVIRGRAIVRCDQYPSPDVAKAAIGLTET